MILNYLKRVNGSGHIVEHVGWHESGDYLLRLLFSEDEQSFRQHKFEVENEYVVIDKSEVDSLERQTCGERIVSISHDSLAIHKDHWRISPNGDRTCSFCGSLHPSDVISIIQEHGFGVIGRTDKSYKWYINRPEVQNAMQGGIKYYRYHDTEEFITAYNSLVTNLKNPNQ